MMKAVSSWLSRVSPLGHLRRGDCTEWHLLLESLPETREQESILSETDNPLLFFKDFGLLWIYQVSIYAVGKKPRTQVKC